ncbi:glycosyltransferase [Conexibacter sp. CPCC 206217]|uniref:glycosyltransferase family 2 protein n=1 Tax=Conexibacter sp. CPCC 206217 TaxID=3064574 RepID=UPI0027176153|nr:glycosyltransferase [Conexibacter sp. CPCC 206217]MDO8209850.1 glycosyltransferase [Conexibacter sp. CPCC 206217]
MPEPEPTSTASTPSTATASPAGASRLLAPAVRVPLAARERPTISVIMPYYKGKDVVCAAVRSVLDQTLAADEIVICDDGSPDDLAAALGDLRAHVRIVRQANGGPASAMNEAARQANGEYVLQLDQDDEFLPRRVEAVSDAIVARPDLDVVATDTLLEYEGSVVARFLAETPFAVAQQREAILQHAFFAWPAIRRTRLLDVGGYDARFFHAYDWEAFIRLVLDGAVVGMVDEPLYRWHLSPGSITSEGGASAEEEIRVLQETLKVQPLAPAERAVAQATIVSTRRRGLLLEAKAAVADGRPDARARALAVVKGDGFGALTRLKAGIAVVSPRLAQRLTRDRYDETERRFGMYSGGS